MTDVEHEGIWAHPGEWLPGTAAQCPQCMDALEAKFVNASKVVHFNIDRLKNDNAGHYTQRELANETVRIAKAEGREIARARQW